MTVPTPPLYLNFNGVKPDAFQVTNNLVNGTPDDRLDRVVAGLAGHDARGH